MLARTVPKLLKGTVFITTASAVFYFIYAPSPAWMYAPVDRATLFSQSPARRELLSKTASDSITVGADRDRDFLIADRPVSYQQNSLAAEGNLDLLGPMQVKAEQEGKGAGANHAPSMLTNSAHAQKQGEPCVPIGGPSSTVMVLGRQVEKCLPELRQAQTAEVQSQTSELSLDDVYITVKTTENNHKTRMLPILLTWLQTVEPNQVAKCHLTIIINIYNIRILYSRFCRFTL